MATITANFDPSSYSFPSLIPVNVLAPAETFLESSVTVTSTTSTTLAGEYLGGTFSANYVVSGNTVTISKAEVDDASTGETLELAGSVTYTSSGALIGGAITGLVFSAPSLGTITLSGSVNVVTGNGIITSLTDVNGPYTLVETGNVMLTAGFIDAGGTISSIKFSDASGDVLSAAGLTDTLPLDTAQTPLELVQTAVAGTSSDILQMSAPSLDLAGLFPDAAISVIQLSGKGSTLTIDESEVLPGGSIVGVGGQDTLDVTGSDIDLSKTTISGFQTFDLDSDATLTASQGTLASVTSIDGGGGDVLVVVGPALNLMTMAIAGFSAVEASAKSTTFTVTQADLDGLNAIEGDGGVNSLVVVGPAIDLTNTNLEDIEIIRSGTVGQTITLSEADLGSITSIAGNGSTILDYVSPDLDVGDAALSGVKDLEVDGGTVSLNQAGLSGILTISTSSGATLSASGNALDLTRVVLAGSFSVIAGSGADTSITVNQGDLASVGSISGGDETDTLVVSGATIDLTNTSLDGIDSIKGAGQAVTLDQTDISGVDAIANVTIVAASDLDLTGVTLTNVPTIKTGAADTTLTLDQSDLVPGGSLIGGGGNNTLVTSGDSFDLSRTTLSKIQTIDLDSGQTVTLSQADLIGVTAISGSGDTIAVSGGAIDLTKTSLTGISAVQGGAATIFTVSQDDLSSIGELDGGKGADTLILSGPAVDITGTTLTSIENIRGNAPGQAITIDQDDLAPGGSLSDAGGGMLLADGSSIDLSGTSLAGFIELMSANGSPFTYTVTSGQLATLGTIAGSSGADTLSVVGPSINVTGGLSGITTIEAAGTTGTVFAGHIGNTQLVGTAGNDVYRLPDDFGTMSIESGGGTDTLDLSAVTAQLLSTTQSGSDLAMSFSDGSTLTILGQFAGQPVTNVILPHGGGEHSLLTPPQ